MVKNVKAFIWTSCPSEGKDEIVFILAKISISKYADDNNNDVAKSNEDSKGSDLLCQKNIGATSKQFQTRVLDVFREL